jgi:MoxR-like ATPase
VRVRTRSDYDHVLTALGICVAARVPVLLWGNPGEGKTSVVESARAAGWLVESLIVSHYEPSDFAGLPVLTGDTDAARSVTLAPPEWAKRLAEHDGPAIAFFDEFSTASPALQAAALRPLTHYEVGSLQLPDTVSFVAAANPSDVAAAGWELAAPTASRFVHLDWALPLEVYAEAMVTGDWPVMPVPAPSSASAEVEQSQRVLVSGFLRTRESQLSAIPRSAAERGRAFPTPRTWDYLARLLGLAAAIEAPAAVRRLLAAGCVGDAVAHEFLAWVAAQDLVDPEKLLADPTSHEWRGMRPDRVYVSLQAVLAVVTRDPTPERWTNALLLCCRAADVVVVDPAVPVVRALVRDGRRPDGSAVPPEITVFAPALALAGLLPGAA